MAEPWRIKMVELLPMPTREERKHAIRQAGYNTFLLPADKVYIDLLTDSGTNAMSDQQWAGMMVGDEAYAGSRSFSHFTETIREIYGYRFVVPTHQGRGAEHILSKALISSGDVIPGNMYFTTTRLHQELAGGSFVDVIIDEANDPGSDHPFKGNVNLQKLEYVIASYTPKKIPYICIGAPVNMAGGQPISLANMRSVRAIAQKHGIRVILDMARVAENAYFIKQREPGCRDMSVREIVREICALTDGACMSAKKDPCANIGGFLATNEDDVFERARNLVVIYEGLHTYGGMTGRDMEAVAIGIKESVDDAHIRARVEQVEYLGKKLLSIGVPLMVPIGGHGVYIDAKRFLSHLSQDQFPAQALTAAIYEQSGVRTMERGIVSAGRDKKTGDHHYPALELVRITIPRRVYTNSHMDFVADAIGDVFIARKKVGGLTMTYEPEHLRFFQAKFSPVIQKNLVNAIV